MAAYNRIRRASLFAFLFSGLFLCQMPQALAQGFPARPIKLVVTYPPGGSSDLMARVMARKMQEVWGQAVVVENKSGAAGSVGMEYAARQAPDGYTFLIGNMGPAAINPLISRLPYDMKKDFIGVSLIATGPNILAVPESSPFKTVSDIVNRAKAKPASVTFGTSGPGALNHLAGELMMRLGGIRMVGVPYKGGGLAVNDLLAGHIDMMISDALPVAQHIKSGRLRALAITSEKRSALNPDIPTFAELGMPGLVAENWWAVYLPAGTPKPIVDQYLQVLNKIMKDPELKQRFGELGVVASVSTQAELAGFVNEEERKWSRIIQDAGISSK
ncbi:MAG: tripartite tricarboxylate transporter substrate binding protein [Bacteroidetes bacterium]|nr:tripartite tricarboxylate transporter substrate binding protein [Bacteroidota bacterium]